MLFKDKSSLESNKYNILGTHFNQRNIISATDRCIGTFEMRLGAKGKIHFMLHFNEIHIPALIWTYAQQMFSAKSEKFS